MDNSKFLGDVLQNQRRVNDFANDDTYMSSTAKAIIKGATAVGVILFAVTAFCPNVGILKTLETDMKVETFEERQRRLAAQRVQDTLRHHNHRNKK